MRATTGAARRDAGPEGGTLSAAFALGRGGGRGLG